SVSHGGVLRTDGAIQVGDTLKVTVSSPAAAATWCSFMIFAAGAGSMGSTGVLGADGSCSLTAVLPPLAYPAERDNSSGHFLDLCIDQVQASFADHVQRVLAMAD